MSMAQRCPLDYRTDTHGTATCLCKISSS